MSTSPQTEARPAATLKQEAELIMICGECCAGKTSVMKRLIKWKGDKHSFPLERVVTTTTRNPRDDERDGVDYHFLNRSTFESRSANGHFIETDCFGRHYYGTQKKDVVKVWQRRHIPVCNNTMPGVEVIKAIFPRICVIFLQATSEEELYARIKRERANSCQESEIKERFEAALREREQAKILADYIIKGPDNSVVNMSELALSLIGVYHKHYRTMQDQPIFHDESFTMVHVVRPDTLSTA